MKIKTIAVLIAILAGQGLMLAACNTTEGFGKDVKSGGQAIQSTAQNAKK